MCNYSDAIISLFIPPDLFAHPVHCPKFYFLIHPAMDVLVLLRLLERKPAKKDFCTGAKCDSNAEMTCNRCSAQYYV